MRYTSATGTYTEKQLIRRYQEHHCVFLSWISLCRNLPHCVAEADSRQICTRWVSGQQCSRHKCPPNHWRAEGQQTPVLPEPVTLNSMTLIHSASPHPPLHHITCALFLFPLLCSRPTPSSLCPLFPFCLSLCFIQDFWTHSCSSLLPWKKTLRSLCHLVSRVVRGVNVKVPAMQGRGGRRCLNEACEVVWTELKLCLVQGGREIHFNGYH